MMEQKALIKIIEGKKKKRGIKEMGLIFVIIVFVLVMFFISMRDNIRRKKSDINFTSTNNLSSAEGIIYPMHIKYRNQLDKWDCFYNYAVYNCILDNKIVSTISAGQETELNVTQGEHIIYFEYKVLRFKI